MPPLSTDAIGPGEVVTVDLGTPSMILSVTPDESFDALSDALMLPQSVGVIWNIRNNPSHGFSNCKLPSGGFGDCGNRYVALTKPAGNEAAYC